MKCPRCGKDNPADIHTCTPDIIRMAREAGWPDSLVAAIIMDKLAEFAALVAAAEREACAEIAREWDAQHTSTNYGACIARLIEERQS